MVFNLVPMADLGAEGTEDLDRIFLDSMQAAIQAMGGRIGGRKRPSDQMDAGFPDQARGTDAMGEETDTIFLEMTGTSVPSSRSTRRFSRSTGLVTPGRSGSSRASASHRAHQSHGSTSLGYPDRSEQAASSSSAGAAVRQSTPESESLASTTDGPASPQASPWTSGESWEPLLPQLDDSPQVAAMTAEMPPVETDEHQQTKDHTKAHDLDTKEIRTEQMTTTIREESEDTLKGDVNESEESKCDGGLSGACCSEMGGP